MLALVRPESLLHQAGDYAAFNFQPLPLRHPPQLADIPELRCISCYDCSMPLTLRPTGLSSPAYADKLDYVVCEDGKVIGRL